MEPAGGLKFHYDGILACGVCVCVCLCVCVRVWHYPHNSLQYIQVSI